MNTKNLSKKIFEFFMNNLNNKTQITKVEKYQLRVANSLLSMAINIQSRIPNNDIKYLEDVNVQINTMLEN